MGEPHERTSKKQLGPQKENEPCESTEADSKGLRQRRSQSYPKKVVCYFFRGTFAPFLRASESPIAIACFLLFTLLVPFFPDFNVPPFRLCIARLTLFWAAFPYFRGIAMNLHRSRCNILAKGSVLSVNTHLIAVLNPIELRVYPN